MLRIGKFDPNFTCNLFIVYFIVYLFIVLYFVNLFFFFKFVLFISGSVFFIP